MLSPLAGDSLDFYNKNDNKSSNICFFIFLAPRQETFADARDGEGGGDIGINICSIHYPIENFQCFCIDLLMFWIFP